MTMDSVEILRSVQQDFQDNAEFVVPGEEAFSGSDYLEGADLREIAGDLIEKYDQFAWLQQINIVYLWKRKGGSGKGCSVLAAIKPVTGVYRTLVDADYIVTVGADNVRDRHFSNFQMHALLFHELSHTALDEKGNPGTRGHEVEAFASEVSEYGLWRQNLVDFGKAVQQSFLDAA